MTKSKFRNSPEAKRWLIVGAYQAGATEKHVARISGLSRTAVRNIILNYQRTGTPCIPKKIPNKIRQKLIVEYDENGNIIDSDDEEEEEVVEQEVIEVPTPSSITTKSLSNEESSNSKDKRKEQFTMKRRIIMKKKHVFKKPNNTAAARNLIKIKNQSNVVTTKDIINYAMDQMRITDNNHINISSQKLIDSPATPTPSWQHNLQQQSMDTNSSSSSSSNGGKSSKLKRLPPPSKFDQNIRGYELWTHDDDMLLLNHVLHHLHGGGWNELELRFNGRHSARLCYDRWKHLKSLLLKGITDKPNTPW